MTPLRVVAVGFIYCCTAIAWFTLGGSVVRRTGEADSDLAQDVSQLWGGHHVQVAPRGTLYRPRTVVTEVKETNAAGKAVTRRVTDTVIDEVALPLESSRVNVEMKLDQRRKGLLWYDTYGVLFAARYRLTNPDDAPRTVMIHYAFPSAEAIYDSFAFRVNGLGTPAVDDLSHGTSARLVLPAHGDADVEIAYRSRGLGPWSYAFAPAGVAQVRDFELAMKTDFSSIDFPSGTLSPTQKTPQPDGYALLWKFDSLVTGQRVGMDPPNRLNPGPLAARITFFAPVSLLFFVTVLLILGVLRGQNLHPMNYFFLAAAFFAFHLLLAYLVDHIDVNAAFLTASAVSVFLVVSYLRVVAGMRMAVVEAGVAQLVFLVLFSYSFFFDGYTGLTVTIGAVVTLFVLMQITARVNWGEVFAGGRVPEGRAAPAHPTTL